MFDIVILGSLLLLELPEVHLEALARQLDSRPSSLQPARGRPRADRSRRRAAGARGIRDLGAPRPRGPLLRDDLPGGTRARAGELGEFKPAGTLALLEEAPETPVVPVAIDESWRLLRHNYLPVPFGTRVRVWLGAPDRACAGEDPMRALDRVRDEIDATLTRWRQSAS